MSALSVCVLVILLYSSPVSSVTRFTSNQESAFLIENQPSKFQCILTWDQGDNVDLNRNKITWIGPNPVKDGDIDFTDANANITVEKDGFKITSTLELPRPHFTYTPHFPSYECKVANLVTQGANQHNFPVSYLKEKAVPVVETPDLPPAEFKESVKLNCTVSYENDNFGARFTFNVSWWKDGKLVENKKYSYTTGNQILLVQYKIPVKSFKDGGRYECQSSLGDTNRKTLVRNDSVVLSILPYLNGPEEKEEKHDAGSDVKLTCDVVGYPIKFEWQDEDQKSFVNESRIRQDENVLYINDIDYDDRKKFLCIGRVGNETVVQTIILRVKDPLAPLWPFICIVAEAIVVAVIILLSEYWKKKQSEKDGGNEKKAEITDQPSTSVA